MLLCLNIDSVRNVTFEYGVTCGQLLAQGEASHACWQQSLHKARCFWSWAFKELTQVKCGHEGGAFIGEAVFLNFCEPKD